jgi:hypothetical protein
MTRVEELTLGWLDGTASPEEREELAALVERDEEARRLHLLAVDVEVSLRARRPVDVTAGVLDQVREEQSDRAVRAVMRHVSSMPPISRGPRPPAPRPRRAPLYVVAGLVSLMGAVIGMRVWRSTEVAKVTAPAAPSPARHEPPVFAIEAKGQRARSTPAEHRGTTEVLALDFEDGTRPATLIDGQVVPGPCPAGTRYCAVGTTSPYDERHHAITVERHRPPLFEYGRGQVLSFDYWVGADASSMRVQVWAGQRRENFGFFLRDLVRERWAHVELRLSELRGYRGRGELDSGDAVRNIMITAGRTGGAPLYIDNLKLVDYAADGQLPPTSATTVLSRQ